jgi:hypothetical protein
VAEEYDRTLSRSAKFIFNLTFPSMAAAGLLHFQCLHLDNSSYIRSDLSQQCKGDQYNSNTAVAVVALIQSIFVPLLLLVVLMFSDRESEFFEKYFGMLTRNYSKRAFFFEPLILIRKFAFVCIAVLVKEPAGQSFWATTLFTLSGLATAAVKPYRKEVKWIAVLDATAHFVLILCLLVGITWFGPSSDPTSKEAAIANIVVIIIVVGFGVLLLGLSFHHAEKKWLLKKCVQCCGKKTNGTPQAEVETSNEAESAHQVQQDGNSSSSDSESDKGHGSGWSVIRSATRMRSSLFRRSLMQRGRESEVGEVELQEFAGVAPSAAPDAQMPEAPDVPFASDDLVVPPRGSYRTDEEHGIGRDLAAARQDNQAAARQDKLQHDEPSDPLSIMSSLGPAPEPETDLEDASMGIGMGNGHLQDGGIIPSAEMPQADDLPMFPLDDDAPGQAERALGNWQGLQRASLHQIKSARFGPKR